MTCNALPTKSSPKLDRFLVVSFCKFVFSISTSKLGVVYYGDYIICSFTFTKDSVAQESDETFAIVGVLDLNG